MSKIYHLRTICEHEIWSGFFGINEHSHQPECGAEIELSVDEESIETEDGKVRPCFSIECPKCKAILDWPQEWEVVSTEEK